jgi:hypothetical protein
MLELTRSRIGRHVNKLRDAANREMQLLQSRQESEIAQLVPPGISDMPRDTDQATGRPSATVEYPVNTINRARNGAFLGRVDLLDGIAGKIAKPERARLKHKTRSRADFDGLRLSNTPSQSQSRSQSEFSTTPVVRDAHGDNSSDLESARSRPTSVAGNAEKSTNATCPTACVLHGLGGVGKTQVALEYYYEHRGEYDASFWIDAEQDWTLASSFARIADKLELLPRKTTEDGGHEVQNKAIEESRNWLQTTGMLPPVHFCLSLMSSRPPLALNIRQRRGFWGPWPVYTG